MFTKKYYFCIKFTLEGYAYIRVVKHTDAFLGGMDIGNSKLRNFRQLLNNNVQRPLKAIGSSW